MMRQTDTLGSPHTHDTTVEQNMNKGRSQRSGKPTAHLSDSRTSILDRLYA